MQSIFPRNYSCSGSSQSPSSNFKSYPSSLSHPTAYPVWSKLDFCSWVFIPILHPSKCCGELSFFQITLQHQQNSVKHIPHLKWPHPPFLSILLQHPALGHFFVVRAFSLSVPASFWRSRRRASSAFLADSERIRNALFFWLFVFVRFCSSMTRRWSQVPEGCSLHI